ncbi:flagellar basal body-associated FliL family protein [Parvularcula sp. ZS-1/3]|uniref:Flagellar protein FliL n=1 Tax=Parvularcula mediterranea TaxID=2732508 RepID=A0A7Y3RPA7_9PROT|nr:flagellar basal body-associated FliL family protein [Parvularcula mediterranea]NNU17295.1 flagellar basal body-associated FliL family protein [Parvularcula mediterranea]
MKDDDLFPQAEKKKGGLSRFLVPAAAAVVIGIGAAVGMRFLGPDAVPSASAGEAPAKKPKTSKKGKAAKEQLLKLEPFVISLNASNGRTRAVRMRFAVAVEVTDATAAEPMRLPLRNAILEGAYTVDPATLSGGEGLSALKEALVPAAKDILGGQFQTLLVTDFVLI